MDWLLSQTRLFRTLLHCYPAEFRHEYGAEMERLFKDRLQSEPRLRLWCETLADIAFTAPKEQWHVLISDLRYGTRVMAAAPGFTSVSLLVIALGIGATVAIFSLVNAVLLRSLPYGQPEKLVYLWTPNPSFKGVPDEMAPNVPDYYDWQHLSHSFSDMTLLRQRAVSLVLQNSSSRVEAAYVTGSFFKTMQVWAALGRIFGDNSDHEAVISRALWQSHFGFDRNVVGRKVQLNREIYTVVGVMPKDFGYPYNGDIPYVQFESRQTDIWLPLTFTAAQRTDRTNFESSDAAIARLRNGISSAAAQAELRSIQARLDRLYPDMWKGWTALARPLVDTIVGPVRQMLWLLLGAVGLVLLIAISNVASLLLARATARAHELGIRTALGAERGRIIRQLLTESLLLSCLGGALGVCLAYAIVRVLGSLNPGDIPRFDTATVDTRVLLVASALAIGTGVLSGLAPAILASRFSINSLLRSGGQRVAGGFHRPRFALIIFEVALSVILLIGSGLLIRSYAQLAAVDPGFSPATLTFHLGLDDRYNKPELRAAFYRHFIEKLKNIPGVKYVGTSSSLPLNNQESLTYAVIRGSARPKEMVETRSITVDYRKAMGTTLLRGRDFDGNDLNSKASVAMVNQSFANTYLQGREALGAKVRIGMGDSVPPWSTIVGIVGDIRHTKLEEAGQPQIYQPVDNGDNFAIQCSTPSAQVINQARLTLKALDPVLTLENVHTMGERISEGNARRRFQTTLLAGFATLAVVLGSVGLYGLMAYSVKQRRSEIGVRLAVGSSRAQVLGLILSQGLRLTAYGLIVGLAGAFAVTRLVSAWLFGVKAFDPATFIAVPLIVLVVACCACLIPAWTATRINPVEALRQE